MPFVIECIAQFESSTIEPLQYMIRHFLSAPDQDFDPRLSLREPLTVWENVGLGQDFFDSDDHPERET